MATQRKKTRDAIEIIHCRYFEGKPKMMAMLDQELARAEVARKLYDLRTSAGLTQRQLAKLVGTTASVICRLEDADYDGHSFSMVNRIAAAMNKRVKIDFVDLSRKRRSA
jgi:DNA-binding XRE family transcriptional regulator